MDKPYDVIIIGGGVIGCSILYQLTTRGFDCVLLEAQQQLVSGAASSGNSGISHCGFDSSAGTTEERLVLDSQPLRDVVQKFKVPYKKIGAIMVAWNTEQVIQLEAIEKEAVKKGLTGLRQLSQSEVTVMEPNLNKALRGGLFVPEEGLVDSWFLPIILAHNAEMGGATIKLGCEVNKISRNNDAIWRVEWRESHVTGIVVINAAGLYGDVIENLYHPDAFKIKPRKGQFLVFDKNAGNLISHIILPIPTNRTKGVLIYPSVHGNLVVGPSAEDCDQRSRPQISERISTQMLEQAFHILPPLRDRKPITTFAGIRPATEQADYHLRCDKNKSWITVGGIRSTGVTASQSIAFEVVEMIEKVLRIHPKLGHRDLDLGIDESKASTACRTYEDCIFENGCMLVDRSLYPITHTLSKLNHRGGTNNCKL